MISAIDYLKDYISSKDDDDDKWLKSVVSCYLNFSEEITDSEIQKLADDLLTNNITEYSSDDYNRISNSSDLIEIKNLVHESGVNALSNNQKIVFNNQVTVLYGLNGSGKSSYFRILQAMLGNIKSSDIIPNIYLDAAQSISVNLEYCVNQTPQSVKWCNNGKISDLKSIKVFDSNYSRKFLEKRESDEQVLFPYKLYAFSEISYYIDRIKKVAIEQLDARMEKNVSPKKDDFIEKEKNRFERELTVADKEYFSSISDDFDEAKEEEIRRTQDEIQLLMETNYSDKLQLLESKKEKHEEVKKRVENTLFSWLDKSVEYHQQIILYRQYKKESEENRKRTKILSDLPGVDSNEWKEFIRKGLLISESSEGLNNTCPYCHREYDEKAFSIVEAYLTFVQDETEAKLSKCESKIRDIINKAKYMKIIKEDYIIEGNEDLQSKVLLLFDLVFNYLESLKKMKDSINDIEPIKFDTTFIISKFKDFEKEYSDEKKKLHEESSSRKDKLEKLGDAKAKLMSQKSIHEQIDSIIDFIDESINISKLRQKISSISSHKISNLSKKAHKGLLSDQLIDKFNDYLVKLGIMGHKIELKNSTSKGVQQTELVMKSKTNVTNILSEGEQKAVSIALFLAEIFVAQNKSSIILDDPVNSLDHKMMDCLSDILLQLDNQVIIFTHNRMFLDSISGSDYGHLCKNFNSNGCNKTKGKHIFIYQVKSEGISEKGVITSKINDNANGYLSDAKELLTQTPFNEELKVCALLRNAIDHIIDEIVFNNQTPRKYSIKGVAQSIQWDDLKNMASNHQMIDDLKRIFGRVSSGELHIGQVSSNNPPEKQELLQLHQDLSNMLL